MALAGNDSIALQKSISMLDRLLVKMDEEGADDLIVASGRRPFVKKLGQMVPLSQTEFSAKEVAGMLTPHLSLAQLEDLKQLRDVDLSHEVKAANLRFRANIFQQRSGLNAGRGRSQRIPAGRRSRGRGVRRLPFSRPRPDDMRGLPRSGSQPAHRAGPSGRWVSGRLHRMSQHQRVEAGIVRSHGLFAHRGAYQPVMFGVPRS